MTPGEFLVHLAQGVLLLLAAWKLVELARHRDVARLDVTLLVLSLLAVGLWLWGRQALDPSLRLGVALVTALHPLLLLRAVQHFRPVAVWVTIVLVAAVLACWALILAPLAGLRGGPAPAAAAGLIFGLATLYTARALWHGARRSQGVVRRRMGLVASGAAVIALLALGQAAALAWPTWEPLWIGASQVGLLAAACLYAFGLAPPIWLARAWQQSELQQFLDASAGRAGEASEEILLRLCHTARQAAGGLAVATARWNETRRRLELELRGERALVGGPLPGDGLVARQWTFRRPFVVDDRRAVRRACQRLAPGLDCGALLGVPLISPVRVYGLLLVFMRRGPLLPDEDLRLLSLLAGHTVVFLDYARLVDDLRREVAGRRVDTGPDEAPLDAS